MKITKNIQYGLIVLLTGIGTISMSLSANLATIVDPGDTCWEGTFTHQAGSDSHVPVDVCSISVQYDNLSESGVGAIYGGADFILNRYSGNPIVIPDSAMDDTDNDGVSDHIDGGGFQM